MSLYPRVLGPPFFRLYSLFRTIKGHMDPTSVRHVGAQQESLVGRSLRRSGVIVPPLTPCLTFVVTEAPATKFRGYVSSRDRRYSENFALE